jgi:hypothetical protein
MQLCLALLGIAAMTLIPVSASAQAPEGKFGLSDLQPWEQNSEKLQFNERIKQDMQQHTFGGYLPWRPNRPNAEEEAVQQYWKRHPNDRPEKWRFGEKECSGALEQEHYCSKGHANADTPYSMDNRRPRPNRPEASEADDD